MEDCIFSPSEQRETVELSEVILMVRRSTFAILAVQSIIGLFLCIKSFPIFSAIKM